ncbi:MAG TPA: hypothetical protein VFC19_30600 [Candidatus Limnocylindrales bacterium]|nr:hypothetical protein [Candidatus Limnocylindrales bacterium]
MSFDLTFVPKSPDQSWDEALDAAEDETDRAPDAQAWARIVDDARQILGDIGLHAGGDYFELDHEPTGIQLSLYAGGAGITVPYWYTGAEAQEIVRTLYRLGAVIEKHTNFSGYDSQAGMPIAEAAKRPELATASFDMVAASFARRDISSPTAEFMID